MRKRYLILLGLCVLLVVAVALRWPRLDPEMVSVTRSEVSGDQMVVEYRMSRPFEVALEHGIRKPIKWPEGPGIHVASSTPLRQDKVEVIVSAYDLLRGEHYVRLCFLRGPSLTVDANGRRLELAAWSAPDARGVRWLPPGEGVRYGQGIGIDILSFGASAEQEEYLALYTGIDARRWVE
jgi:hypothetical protein